MLWIIFGIVANLFFAISATIDKSMMNHKFKLVKTNAIKTFYDGMILLFFGIIFFDVNFFNEGVLIAAALGFIYATAGVLDFNALRLKDVEEVVPFSQSSMILLTFLGSLLFLGEKPIIVNYVGLVVILIGIYVMLSNDGIHIPKIDKGFFFMSSSVILLVIYSLIVKKTLFNVEPINLAIMMYFFTTFFLILYQLIFEKKKVKEVFPNNIKYFKTFGAAFFGAIGMLCSYTALSIADVSKVMPLVGLQSVFVFLIATIFLREKFFWHRLFGTIIIVSGITLVTMTEFLLTFKM